METQTKLLSVIVTTLTLTLLACQNPTPQSDTQSGQLDDAGLAANRFIDFAARGGSPDELDQILTEDYVLYTSGTESNREAFKAAISGLNAAAPDARAEFRILEIDQTPAILYEIVSGTHTGAPLFGVQAGGHAFSFTNLNIIETRGDRIARHWAQADLGATVMQLTGMILAKSSADLWSELDAAQLANGGDCENSGKTSRTDDTWERFRIVMENLDASDAVLDGILTPNFRLSAQGNLNQTREGVKATFNMAATFGRNHGNSGMVIAHSGAKYTATYGSVRFTYDNPNGALGFPASQQPIDVAMTELQIIGRCHGKVFYQFSHADVFGLMAQISPAPPRTDKEIAMDFLTLSPQEVRAILADDFKHQSPAGKFENADDFVAHFAANEPPQWSIEVNEILEGAGSIYLDYFLVVPGFKFQIIDRLVIRDGLVQEGKAFFLDKIPTLP